MIRVVLTTVLGLIAALLLPHWLGLDEKWGEWPKLNSLQPGLPVGSNTLYSIARWGAELAVSVSPSFLRRSSGR